ncbi:MAG: hypothetical protein ACUVRD_07000 [Bacteroidia bacterium]
MLYLLLLLTALWTTLLHTPLGESLMPRPVLFLLHVVYLPLLVGMVLSWLVWGKRWRLVAGILLLSSFTLPKIHGTATNSLCLCQLNVDAFDYDTVKIRKFPAQMPTSCEILVLLEFYTGNLPLSTWAARMGFAHAYHIVTGPGVGIAVFSHHPISSVQQILQTPNSTNGLWECTLHLRQGALPLYIAHFPSFKFRYKNWQNERLSTLWEKLCKGLALHITYEQKIKEILSRQRGYFLLCADLNQPPTWPFVAWLGRRYEGSSGLWGATHHIGLRVDYTFGKMALLQTQRHWLSGYDHAFLQTHWQMPERL